MNDFEFDITPDWNRPMSRRDYMLNNVCLFFTFLVLAIALGAILSVDFVPLSMASLLMAMLGTFYGVYLTIVWSYTRLKDAGLSSEGWRVFWIVVSVFIGLIGFLMFLYCCIKPTEDPRELTVEDDDDCRDEGPR